MEFVRLEKSTLSFDGWGVGVGVVSSVVVSEVPVELSEGVVSEVSVELSEVVVSSVSDVSEAVSDVVSEDSVVSEEDVVSHNANAIRSTPVTSSSNILLLATDVDVVGIDEAQFFDNGIVDVCTTLANNGVRVIVAGLDMDFMGKPFGPMPQLMAIAEDVTKVHAICMRCGSLAQYSHRTIAGDKLVVLGETESYEPLCRECYNKAMAEKAKEK